MIYEKWIRAIAGNDYDILMCLFAKERKGMVYSSKTNKLELKTYSFDEITEIGRNKIRKLYVGNNVETFIENNKYIKIKKELENNKEYVLIFSIKEEGKILRKKCKYYYIDKEKEIFCFQVMDVTNLSYENNVRDFEVLEALNAAEDAIAIKNSFVERMNRIIRTPANSILGMSILARDAAKKNPFLAKYLDRIIQSSKELVFVMDDILEMSKVENKQIVFSNEEILVCNFVNSLNEACYRRASMKNVDYECIEDYNLDLKYAGDTDKLSKIITNVVFNAIKFTDGGGKVRVFITELNRDNDFAYLRFDISDTGCGIEQSFLPTIFEPFSKNLSSKDKGIRGIGLGLSIAKRLAELMNGSIRVESTVGVGSKFTVDLKLALDKEESQTSIQFNNADFLLNKSVLIVDDEILICEQVEKIFNNWGVKTECVSSGELAIEKIQMELKKNKMFDIIIVDLKMPGMDGLQTIENIRKITSNGNAIILLATYEGNTIEKKAIASGATGVLDKPINCASLLKKFQCICTNISSYDLENEIDYIFVGKRALVVEDHRINREMMGKILKSRGFEVEFAVNCIQALEMYIMNPSEYYDAIIMDITIPGLDGITTASLIRKMHKEDSKNIPIIAMTANVFDDDLEKLIESGMNFHLLKPINPKALFNALHRFIILNEK